MKIETDIFDILLLIFIVTIGFIALIAIMDKAQAPTTTILNNSTTINVYIYPPALTTGGNNTTGPSISPTAIFEISRTAPTNPQVPKPEPSATPSPTARPFPPDFPRFPDFPTIRPVPTIPPLPWVITYG
jgi:hypothetical protein